ncbi:MAG TPA: porin PorA family protein, partial [Ornithinibacter sp.]|nr:porin PorA family protein [Ornithinibacter sp.]
MRKTVGLVLLGLAAFLITAALLVLLWVPGQVMRTPLDVDTTTRLTGDATVLPSGPGSPLKAISRSVADGQASTSEVVVFDTFSCLIKDTGGTAPDCVDDQDPDSRLVTAGTDRFATDRKTALAVNDEKYVGVGAEPHDGLVNKFPFEVEQKTYPFWDGLVGRAVDATFQGEEEIDGLATYKFNIAL